MMFLRLRFSTGGDAHGPELVGILSGLPAGLPVDLSLIRQYLRLRREAGGRGGRSRWIEQDDVEIRGGVYQGTTSGAPLVLAIPNRGARDWEQEPQPRVARPGHADFPGMLKYGWTSW
ncbi:MAG: chorismate synthase, partial [Candidatus Hydrothermae bacterium]|nr:chorismate synthase [Candidatus Hydrothermae bacterium]